MLHPKKVPRIKLKENMSLTRTPTRRKDGSGSAVKLWTWESSRKSRKRTEKSGCSCLSPSSPSPPYRQLKIGLKRPLSSASQHSHFRFCLHLTTTFFIHLFLLLHSLQSLAFGEHRVYFLFFSFLFSCFC